MDEFRPESSRPAGRDELAAVYLRGRDVACPGCGYNRRDGTGAACPECGVGYRVGPDQSSLRAGYARVLGWLGVVCLGAGINGSVILVYFTISIWNNGGMLFTGMPPMFYLQFLTPVIHAACLVPGVLLRVQRSRFARGVGSLDRARRAALLATVLLTVSLLIPLVVQFLFMLY